MVNSELLSARKCRGAKRGDSGVSIRFHALALSVAASLLIAGASKTNGMQTIEIKPDGRILHVSVAKDAGGKSSEMVIARVKRGDDGVVRRFVARYSIPVDASEGAASKLIVERRVPDDVVAFGLGDFFARGKPQIVYFTAESVFVVDGATERTEKSIASEEVNASIAATDEVEMVKLLGPHRFVFNRPSPYSLPFWDLIGDVDGDKRDDIIVADSEGYAVYVQSEAGALKLAGRPKIEYNFSTRAEMGGYLPTEAGASNDTQGQWGSPWRRAGRRTGGFTPGAQPILTTRSINRVIGADANADGKIDLFTIKGDRLLTFLQTAEGFKSEHDLARDFSGEITKRSWDEGNFTLVHADANGDGRADVILSEIEPQDLTTKIRLYFGTENGISEQPAQVLKMTGLGDNPELRDVNGDGLADLTFLVVRADKILALKKASVEELEAAYYIYLFDKAKNQFTTRPDIRREFTISLEGDIEREQSREFFQLADVNGDGVQDLACYENKGALNVFAIEAGGKEKMNVKLASGPLINLMTTAPESIRSDDLDGNGKDDLILIYAGMIRILKN